MATNLSDIGFTQTGAELEALARKCFQNGRATRCEKGTYIVWALGSGIELWIQLTPNEELIGMNPHFSGKTRTSAGLEKRVHRAGFPMDGGFVALAQPYGNEQIHGTFRFVFDTPNFHAHSELKLPVISSVQLTAFAQQCVVAPSEAEFRAASTRSNSRLSIDAFMPVGLNEKGRKTGAEPAATAMICGVILDCEQILNPTSKARFWWMRIRNSVGEIDVVADPELLPKGAKVGGVLQCSAWVSGRII
ncbi:MAG TPA: hypothetical protein VGP72_16880 [Planctomycetota bacterium]